MAKVSVMSTPAGNDDWVYSMYKDNGILEKLEKLRRRILFKTTDTQADDERQDILWIKEIIKMAPYMKPSRYIMKRCNELWKKYK